MNHPVTGSGTAGWWVLLPVMTVFMMVNAVIIVWDQRQEMAHAMHGHIQEELELMAQVVKESAIRNDLATVQSFLESWARRSDEIIAVDARATNGFSLVRYQRSRSADRFASHVVMVSHEGRDILRLELRHDLEVIDRATWRMAWQTGVVAILLTLFFGLVLWATLNVTTIRPLLREITRRKTVEEAMERLHRLHASILEAAGEGIFGLDQEGNTTFVNPAALRMTGRTSEELVGRHQHELLHHAHSDGSPHSWESCPIHTTMREGILHHVDNEVFWHANGESFPVEYVCTPLLKNGRVQGAVVIFRDVSERLHWMESLRQSEERYRALVEMSPDAILAHQDGRIVYGNAAAARLFGATTVQELIGLPVPELVAPEYREIVTDRIAEILGDRTPAPPLREKLLRLDGTQVDAEVTGGHVFLNGRDAVQVVARDITMRIRLEEELLTAKQKAEDANEAKSRFLAAMSHDIRTPMNIVLGLSELLLENETDEERQRYVRTLHTAGRSLLALINDILDLSRIEAGRLELERMNFDPRELVAEIMGLFASEAKRKGVALHCRLGQEIPLLVHGDPARLQQVLLNLLGNAVKFTHEGEIALEVRNTRENLIRFCIEDTGIGIPAEQRELVFEPFAQAMANIPRQYGGTGLGLAICRRLVELMGGWITVESALGLGSRFQFTIPLPGVDVCHLAVEEPLPLPAMRPSQAGDRQKLTILLVDDFPDNRLLIRAFLKETGHVLAMAEDGAEAVRQCQGQRFDLVLMDVQMPVMDGYAATRAIRAFESAAGLSPTPIVALTAYAMKEDVEQALAAGCDAHLAKPVVKKNLLALLARFQQNAESLSP